jgi:hypothetical protein
MLSLGMLKYVNVSMKSEVYYLKFLIAIFTGANLLIVANFQNFLFYTLVYNFVEITK